MNRSVFIASRTSALAALILVACFSFAQKLPEKTKPTSQGPAASAAKKPAAAGPTVHQVGRQGSASLQTHRNVGRAYYEQGKYAEAITEFQQVVAPGQALATDHLNLGLALMQANKLNEALGELTTAKQMDPKLVAADYNLGILYKRELRYPDAEAALKRVIEADPNDPASWFNLGTVHFAQKDLEAALDAHQHVLAMGFGRGQNFYVASLFHTFTTLVRLKRQAEAQKVLKQHEKIRDKVPGISLQNPALEGGKYGTILVPPAPSTQVARQSALDRVTFTEITSKLGIKLPASVAQAPGGTRREIKASDYSLDFARQNLLPLFGASVALGDYDGDGHLDIYVLDPTATNHLFHNNGDGTFTEVTEKAGVAGTGQLVSHIRRLRQQREGQPVCGRSRRRQALSQSWGWRLHR